MLLFLFGGFLEIFKNLIYNFVIFGIFYNYLNYILESKLMSDVIFRRRARFRRDMCSHLGNDELPKWNGVRT